MEAAREKFFHHGFSKVTMEELALELGMSKKTLYKHFPQKTVLLREVVEMTLSEMRSGVEALLNDETAPFTVRLQKLLRFVGVHASKFLQRDFLTDLQRNAPAIWSHIEAFRKEMIHTRFARLIRQGVEQGVFRSDVDQELVVLIYFSLVQNIINPATLSNLPFTTKQVFDSIIKLLLEGLLTEGARSQLTGEG
ncbi:MAG: TetR/AcrR family transcriptional regulator [bacterium]